MQQVKVAVVSAAVAVAIVIALGAVGRGATLVQPAAAGGLEFNPKLNAYVTTLGDDGLIVWHVENGKIGRATQYYVGHVIVPQKTKTKPDKEGAVPVFEEKVERYLFSEEYGPAPAPSTYRGDPVRLRNWVNGTTAIPVPPAPATAPAASCGAGGSSCG